MKRRQFLGAGLSLPFLTRTTWAAPSTSPKRLLVFFNYHGIVYDSWNMIPENSPLDTDWQNPLPSSFEAYSPELSPLYPFRNRATVIDGLAMVSADSDSNAAGLRHEAGAVHSLSGNLADMVSFLPMATTPSVDQLVANHIALPDQFHSLEWGVGLPTNSPIYRDRHVQLSPELSPLQAYLRLFGQSTRPATTPSAQSLLIQALQGRYAKQVERLPSTRRSSLITQLDLLGDLDKRLAGLARIRSDCQGQNAPSEAEDYELDFAAFSQLIATALSCDFTRVLSLNMGSIPMEMLSGRSGDVHTEYAHRIFEDPEARDNIILHYQLNATHFAELADVLDGITDPLGDGVESLLDNTLMVWVSEVADGAHSFDRWPVVTLGGDSFSPFPKGQYQYFPSSTPFSGWSFTEGYIESMALPHQKLLTTIAQTYGIDTDCVGTREILGNHSTWIDCTGTLF